MANKQTAVELLEKELLEYLYYCVIESVEKDNRFIRIDVLRVKPMFDRAKQMEKEQIVHAYNYTVLNLRTKDGEQYYNETFKSE